MQALLDWQMTTYAIKPILSEACCSGTNVGSGEYSLKGCAVGLMEKGQCIRKD
jgi:hypothetical protein